MKVWKQWKGLLRPSEGASSEMGIIWNPSNVQITLLGEDKYWQHCLVTSLCKNESFNLFNVYGPSATNDKRELWALLSNIFQNITMDSCVFAGDFNAILASNEKQGGIQRIGMDQKDFQDFVDKNQLLDVALKNGTFTWTNRHTGFTKIAERLDQFLVAGDWLAQNIILESTILPLIGSDHFPICLNVSLGHSEGGHPFRFELMWLRVPDLHDLIAALWNEPVLRNKSRLFKLNKKLKYIKIKIKEWNLSQFQNIHMEKLRVTAELEDLSNFVIKSGMNEVLFQRESSLKSKLNEILQREEIH
ncbi:uncharacterized protein LOC131875198 [Cryptomeria japonica]|uniref:uncharacterized protein LOC131875198 n=1 Tax=Cryptomeria japonica TaxID=3369 RepID=UPI0027DAB0ED|nr:uncharacterized protein LOC131875198 [Cryptomeria japonica]